MKKKDEISLDDLTKKEISIVEANDKLLKLEREKIRDKKIIAEYKEVSVSKAMRISIEITKGHKWDLFIMYLSFLGWVLLSVLTVGILNFWLIPYMNMTYVNAYHALMKEALESGRIRPEDLTE